MLQTPTVFEHRHNNVVNMDPGTSQTSDIRAEGIQPISVSVSKSERKKKEI